MDGRVRWFLGLARNSVEYSLAITGTPWDVPEPRMINEKDMTGRKSRGSAQPRLRGAPRHATLIHFAQQYHDHCFETDSAKNTLPNHSIIAKFSGTQFCHADHAAYQEPGLGRRSHPGTPARLQRHHWRNRRRKIGPHRRTEPRLG